MSTRKRGRPGQVLLIAFDEEGRTVEELELPFETYYERSCELIDSSDYRVKKGIHSAKGEVYDLDGRLEQNFENRYSAKGTVQSSRTVHSVGQVTEQTFEN